ncbi:hypothetical protein ACYSNV_02335 [Myroides sp. LJL119]
MKKDIEIPKVENVEIAIVKEYNQDFLSDSWYAYLFNNNDKPLEAILIVSQAKGMLDGHKRESSLFRHAFPALKAKESLKIELIDQNVFALDNHFMLTYFLEGKLFDKTFIFKANTINDQNLKQAAFTDKKLILP